MRCDVLQVGRKRRRKEEQAESSVTNVGSMGAPCTCNVTLSVFRIFVPSADRSGKWDGDVRVGWSRGREVVVGGSLDPRTILFRGKSSSSSSRQARSENNHVYRRQVACTYKDTAHSHLLVASTGCLHHPLPTPQYLSRHTKTISQAPLGTPSSTTQTRYLPRYQHDALPPLPRLRALHSSRNGISSSIFASNLPSLRQHFAPTITTEQCRVWSAHESPKSNKPVRWTGGHQEWNERTTFNGCSHSLGPRHCI